MSGFSCSGDILSQFSTSVLEPSSAESQNRQFYFYLRNLTGSQHTTKSSTMNTLKDVRGLRPIALILTDA